MRGFLLASSNAGRKACSQPNPTNRSKSARFICGTKLGFIGTPCVSSMPVARLKTSTRSPPISRAKSARSVSVAITRILAAPAGSAARATTASATSDKRRNSFDFIKIISLPGLALLPSVRVRADDPRPLQVDGVVGAQAGHGIVIGVRVLQTQLVPVAQGPGDIGRVGKGFVAMVLRVLQPVKQETRAPLPVPLVRDV